MTREREEVRSYPRWVAATRTMAGWYFIKNVPCYKVGGAGNTCPPPLPSPLDPLKGNGFGFLLLVCVWSGLARVTTTLFHF